jgi:hypothetical protein
MSDKIHMQTYQLETLDEFINDEFQLYGDGYYYFSSNDK